MTGRIFKPSPPHNHLFDGAPAQCMCLDCCRDILTRRCSATDRDGNQCGDYKGHRSRFHPLIVATVFAIAEERVRLDA